MHGGWAAVRLCGQAGMCVCVCARARVCVHACVCMYVCVCVRAHVRVLCPCMLTLMFPNALPPAVPAALNVP